MMTKKRIKKAIKSREQWKCLTCNIEKDADEFFFDLSGDYQPFSDEAGDLICWNCEEER